MKSKIDRKEKKRTQVSWDKMAFCSTFLQTKGISYTIRFITHQPQQITVTHRNIKLYNQGTRIGKA